jgi:hypothetical protein
VFIAHKAFRYRLYPNQQQATALTIQFGHARFVYNWALATRKEHYQQHGQGLSGYDLNRQLTALKHEAEYAWLQEADSQVLQAKVQDLDRAYQNFFRPPRPVSALQVAQGGAEHSLPAAVQVQREPGVFAQDRLGRGGPPPPAGGDAQEPYRLENQEWRVLRVRPVRGRA